MNFHFTTDINLRPEKLFPWIANPDEALLWQIGVKKEEIIKETPERVGTTFKEVLEEDGMELEMQGEITGYIENKSISFHLESKIHTVEVTYAISGHAEYSTLDVVGSIKWKFPMNIISFLFSHNVHQNIAKQTMAELTELKSLCEDSHHLEQRIREKRKAKQQKDELVYDY